MTWMRIPLFVWAIVTYAWLLVIVLPMLSAGLTLMLLDRQAGTHFFDPAHGGSPILYQHVFWFFGHPEVYIMILPAMGIVSEIIPVFARKPIFGYKAVAISTVGIAFYSLLVWAHHMFAVGLPIGLDIFFMLSSMVIADPDRREDLQLARDASGAGTSRSTRRCFGASASSACSRSAGSRGSSWPRSRSTGR